MLANRNKPGVGNALREIEGWANRTGVEVVSNPGPESGSETEDPFAGATQQHLRATFAGAELLITLGGDGTLLYGAQVVAPLRIPVLSVNLGSLGFHTQVEPPELALALELFAEGRFSVQPRMLLQAVLGSPAEGPEPALALNDVVISKSAWGHMVHLRLFINGETVTDISADGLVIATPTGSSAYNFAAGGPVLYPTVEAIVLNAICPHRMNFSPLVVAGEVEIEVQFHPRKPLEDAQLLVDGQLWRSVAHEETLKISKAAMYLPLVVVHQNFYGKLREKLRWGGLL